MFPPRLFSLTVNCVECRQKGKGGGINSALTHGVGRSVDLEWLLTPLSFFPPQPPALPLLLLGCHLPFIPLYCPGVKSNQLDSTHKALSDLSTSLLQFDHSAKLELLPRARHSHPVLSSPSNKLVSPAAS